MGQYLELSWQTQADSEKSLSHSIHQFYHVHEVVYTRNQYN